MTSNCHPSYAGKLPALAIGLTLFAGCVEAPQPDEFENADPVSALEDIQGEKVDSNESASIENSTTTPASNDDDGWKAMPDEKANSSPPEKLSDAKKAVLAKLLTDDDNIPSDKSVSAGTDGGSLTAIPEQPSVPAGDAAAKAESQAPPALPKAGTSPIGDSPSKPLSLIPGGLGETATSAPQPKEPESGAASPFPTGNTDPKQETSSATENKAPALPALAAPTAPTDATIPVEKPALVPAAPEAKPAVAPLAIGSAEPEKSLPTVKAQGDASPAAPAPISEPAPVEPPAMRERPRSLIVLSPRKLEPGSGTAPPASSSEKTTDGKTATPAPAVVLPPSTAADPPALARVETTPPALPSLEPPATPSTTSAEEATKQPDATTPAPMPLVATPPAAPPEGFVSLINGHDLTGWTVYDGKAESWRFLDGAVSCVAPGGGWLQTEKLYSDFELRLEYRLSPGGNSGVSMRFPGTGNPALDGLEIQMIDDKSEKYQSIQPHQASGSLYFAVGPKERDVTHPAGEWNQCVLVCEGSKLKVTINDRLVNEIDLDQLTKTVAGESRKVSTLRSPVGSIALQSHATRVDFRNIYVKDLTKALASGVRWLDLVPGSGEEVPTGAKVTVHYIGHLMTGKKFASSVDKNKPATVPLKDVIPGWREGIPGMKVGGKRRLIVPAEYAYGAKGFKEIVPPNATLVYEIELLGFERPTDSVIPPQSAESQTPSPTTR